jgi:hypothetical protein
MSRLSSFQSARSTSEKLRIAQLFSPATLVVAATAALCSAVLSPVQAQQTPTAATAEIAKKAALREALNARFKDTVNAQAYLDEAGGFRHAELDEPLVVNMAAPAAFTPKISATAAGGTRASLGASAMHFSVVHKHADGSLHSNCVEGDDLGHSLKHSSSKVEANNDR